MSNVSGEYVSLTELQHAENLDELFRDLPERFEAHWDEVYHSHPDNPSSAAQAGADDAKKSPPIPASDSEMPTGESTRTYIGALYGSASVFFKKTIMQCRERFDSMQQSIEAKLSLNDNIWQDDRSTDWENLCDAVNEWSDSRIACKNYEDENKKLIGNEILDPKPHPMFLFVCLVLFIIVFEFVWVWYFLSDQLGFSAAINGSISAATAVVLIAFLLALSWVNTKRDVAESRRMLAYSSMAFLIFLFLFSLGLLSAWRADSTGEGFAFIVDGYRSMTQLDVFLTALINLGGVVLLTHEFKQFICPYPLYHYKERLRKAEYDKERATEEKRKLEEKLEEREIKIRNVKLQIENLLGDVDRYANGAERHIRTAASTLDAKVSEIRQNYIQKNVEYRTVDAFPEPEWFAEGFSKFTVRNCSVEKEIEELYSYFKETNNSESRAQKSNLEQNVESALREIQETQTRIKKLFERQSESNDLPTIPQT